MKTDIVIDANILFASLIKHGVTAKLLFSENYRYFAPEFLFEEFSKYKKIILKKTHRSSEEFETYLNIMKNRIEIISITQITPFLKKAAEISPDPKDSVYLALAIKLDCDLWSNDRILKEKQSVVKIITTSEMLQAVNYL